MPIDFKELVQEYYQEKGQKYPLLTLDDFMMICRAPFLFFRKQMESMDFPRINIKYFGKFVVWPGSAKKMIEILYRLNQLGRITDDEFKDRTVNLKAYIDDYEAKLPDDSHRKETLD